MFTVLIPCLLGIMLGTLFVPLTYSLVYKADLANERLLKSFLKVIGVFVGCLAVYLALSALMHILNFLFMGALLITVAVVVTAIFRSSIRERKL